MPIVPDVLALVKQFVRVAKGPEVFLQVNPAMLILDSQKERDRGHAVCQHN
jgi:hypothetical protein